MALPRIPTDLFGRELWLMLARDQYGRQLLREVDGILLDSFKEITRRLVTAYPTLGPRETQRLSRLFGQVSDLLGERYGTVSSTLTTQLQAFGQIESAIAREEIALRVGTLGALDASLGAISRRRVVAMADVLLEGRSMPAWWRIQAQRMTEATRRQVQIGLTLGESTAKVVNRIVPPRNGTEPAVYRQAKRDATTLVRTAVTGVASEAQLQALAAMDPRITDRYQWSAIRDKRTSLICIALDGQVFRYDDKTAPRPPGHMNCRSTIIAVIDYKGLGIKPPANAGPGGWRDYEAWLRAQPESVQKQILGAGRWALWNSGKITLRDLIDDDNRTLSLEKLRELAGVPATPPTITPPPPPVAKPSDRVQVTGSQALKDDVNKALSAIETVHQLPIDASTVQVVAGTQSARGVRGEYFPAINRLKLHAADRRVQTFIHEFGHFTDTQAFGKADALIRDPAQSAPGSLLGRYMLSERSPASPAWEELWKAVEASQHVGYWKHVRATSPLERRFADYLLSRVELFARAYERWIFERLPATHPLKKQLEAYVRERVGAQWLWTDQDFVPIGKGMDAVFKERGWLRSTK